MSCEPSQSEFSQMFLLFFLPPSGHHLITTQPILINDKAFELFYEYLQHNGALKLQVCDLRLPPLLASSNYVNPSAVRNHLPMYIEIYRYNCAVLCSGALILKFDYLTKPFPASELLSVSSSCIHHIYMV